mmetsp:Transcript_49376/g.139318  ORF Transcript_49376/g.139318 Transcript_49376/m.139318 type:complete len:243 (+) Transcript_49376:1861-2589(+)
MPRTRPAGRSSPWTGPRWASPTPWTKSRRTPRTTTAGSRSTGRCATSRSSWAHTRAGWAPSCPRRARTPPASGTPSTTRTPSRRSARRWWSATWSPPRARAQRCRRASWERERVFRRPPPARDASRVAAHSRPAARPYTGSTPPEAAPLVRHPAACSLCYLRSSPLLHHYLAHFYSHGPDELHRGVARASRCSGATGPAGYRTALPDSGRRGCLQIGLYSCSLPSIGSRRGQRRRQPRDQHW